MFSLYSDKLSGFQSEEYLPKTPRSLADREMKTMIFEAVNVVEGIQEPFYLYTVDYW